MTDQSTISALDPILVLADADLLLADQSNGDGTFVTKKITAANVSAKFSADAGAAASGYADAASASATAAAGSASSASTSAATATTKAGVATTQAGNAASSAAQAALYAGVQAILFTAPVISVLGTPPGSPSSGDRYLVAHSGTSGAWVGKEDQVAQYVSGAWAYSGAPTDGQQIYVQATQKRYRYASANSQWKKVNSKYVFQSDFTSYALALAFAAAASAVLVIDEDGTVATNTTPTVTHRFSGGVLAINNGVTLDLSSAAVDAPLTQIFDVSAGGVVNLGAMLGGSSVLESSARAPDIWVEWFGALPHIQTSGQQSLNVAAFNAAFQSSYSAKIGIGPGGFYFNGSISPTTAPYNGIIEGRGRHATNLYFATGSDGFVFTGAYNLTMKSMTLWGGNRQVYLNIANVDSTVITIDDIWFKTPAMWAVKTSATANSTLLTVKNSVWTGATGTNGFIWSHCDYTYCNDCWGEPSGSNVFYNDSGNFYVTRFVGVGATNPADCSWAENYSSFYYTDCRLSADGGGNRTAVNHRATPANLITFSIKGGFVGNGGAPYAPSYVFYTLPQNLFVEDVVYSSANGVIQVMDLSGSDGGAAFAIGACSVVGAHAFYAAGSGQVGQILVAHSNRSALTPWFRPRLADVKWSYDSTAYFVDSSSHITVGTATSANYLGGITLAKFTATADDAAVVISRTDSIVSTPLTDNAAYTASCDFLYTGSGPCTLSIQVYGSLRHIDLEPGAYRNVQIPFVKLTSGVPAGLIISASGMPNGAVLTPLRFTCQVGRAAREKPQFEFFDASGNSITDTAYIGYYIGDRWDYSNPASAGYMGKVVTAAGTNGSETWKTWGAVS